MKNKIILEGRCKIRGYMPGYFTSSNFIPYVCEQNIKYPNLVKFDIETGTPALNFKTKKKYTRYDTHHIYVWNVTNECQLKLFPNTVVRVEGVLRSKILKNGEEQISVEATSIKVKQGKYFRDIKTGKF